MLQQTQAPRVVSKYKEWMKFFPNFKQLAQAPLKDVLAAWQGLGYNRRALNLKRTAEIITDGYRGELPHDYDALVSLPGIGSYTAHAIRVFTWNLPDVVIETNIRSVFLHHFFKNKTDVPDRDILPFIEQTLNKENPREWYWALMDYGSHLKKKDNNLSRRAKTYTTQSKFKGSDRELRAKILRYILTHETVSSNQLHKEFRDKREMRILHSLIQESFVTKRDNSYTIRS
jgi:A/G-specific adenine glycosylase